MEGHFSPDVQEKLDRMTRATIDRRYDDLESGRVKAVPGDEVFARLRAKSAARRAERS
jgi:putative addiction module component (TIGR02574 family)